MPGIAADSRFWGWEMKALWLAILMMVFLTLPSCAQLEVKDSESALKTDKGSYHSGRGFSDAEEAEIGQAIAAAILGENALHRNENLQRYVNRVGYWIALRSTRPDLQWSFGILDTPTINAFAVPGGTVFISVGLIKKLNSESELAGVLAHEIAHVTQRHHLHALTDYVSKQEILAFFDKRNSHYADAKKKLITGSIEIFSKGLARKDEYEADRIGAALVARAGYDPYGLAAYLQMLSTLTQQESNLSLLVQAHPQPAERINELEKHTAMLDRYASQPQVTARFKAMIKGLK